METSVYIFVLLYIEVFHLYTKIGDVSILYKLVYGSARMDRGSLKEVEGLKAFFVNDPSLAITEIRELSQLDLDKSGTIDISELEALKNKKIHLTLADKTLELLSTHPNMLKRIKRLSEYRA